MIYGVSKSLEINDKKQRQKILPGFHFQWAM